METKTRMCLRRVIETGMKGCVVMRDTHTKGNLENLLEHRESKRDFQTTEGNESRVSKAIAIAL